MSLLRYLVLLLPLALAWLAWLCLDDLRHQNQIEARRFQEPEIHLVGVAEALPTAITADPGTRLGRKLETLLFEPVLRVRRDGSIGPGLVDRWELRQISRFHFQSESLAEKAFVELDREGWEDWSQERVTSTSQDGKTLSIELATPSSRASGEIVRFLDRRNLELVNRIEVETITPTVMEWHRHFMAEAVETSQLISERQISPHRIELSCVGDPQHFIRELKAFYETGEEGEQPGTVRLRGADFSQDSMRLDLWLRKGASWGNGRVVRAEDLKEALTEHVARGPENFLPFAEIREIEAIEGGLLRCHYRRPYAMALASWAAVLARPSTAGIEPTLGTSGWKLEERTNTQLTDLSLREPLGEGAFGWLALTDPMLRNMRLRRGDVASYWPAREEIPVLRKAGFSLEENLAGERLWLVWNMTQKNGLAPELRRYLADLLPPATLINELEGNSPLWPASSWVPCRRGAASQIRDIRETLPVFEVQPKLHLLVNQESSTRLSLAENIAKRWSEAGFETLVESVEWAEYLRRSYDLAGSDAPHVILAGWRHGPCEEASSLWHSALAPPRGANLGHYANEEIDSLLEEMGREWAEERRQRLLRELAFQLDADPPCVPLFDLLEETVIVRK